MVMNEAAASWPMSSELFFAGLAVLGQLANMVLNLRITNAILASKLEVFEQMKREYRTKDACDTAMAFHDRRLAVIETRI